MLEFEDAVARLYQRCQVVLTKDKEQKPIVTNRSPGCVHKRFFLHSLDLPRNSDSSCHNLTLRYDLGVRQAKVIGSLDGELTKIPQ